MSRWPSGIFRRAFIRAYAEAIGLDADAVSKEFMERYPDPAEVHPVEPPAAAPGAAAASRNADGAKPAPLITVTVRVPRWMTERLFTVVRPWSRA